MPATEQTWRDLKVLHIVFGVVAIVLLVATVVMLSLDHNRPWKKYQRTFRNLETWSASAKVDAENSRAFAAKTSELEASLADVRRADLEPALVTEFLGQVETVKEDKEAAALAREDVTRLREVKDPDGRFQLRGDLLQRFQDIVDRSKFREDNLAGSLKLKKAKLDKRRADYELAVSEEADASKQKELLALADGNRKEVAEATLAFQAANTHRKQLVEILRKITATEDAASKSLADHRQTLALLKKTLNDRAPNLGKTVLELPVLDAFNSPLRIDQIWLPKLTLNNNFRDVARFDRCTTCHQGMDKSAAGSPSEPAYPEATMVEVILPTPNEPPASGAVENESLQMEDVFGFQLAPKGLFREEAPTVSVVLPESPAAIAGLQSGDVITAVGGGRTSVRELAVAALLENVSWGTPLRLDIQRGVPQPYATHPRLDLFVSDSSPHSMKTFGCTICHQGQGSATSFKWSSHSPNTPKQSHVWHDEYGWFNNHHWIFPMLPERFEESSCLKCHHEVVDLEPSERFPEPPAPKVVAGYHLIRQYGCYGCHEIKGWSGPDQRVGPDLRLEPNYHEVAQAVSVDPGVREMDGTFNDWVTDVISSPDGNNARQRLREAIDADAALGDDAKLSDRTHVLASLLKTPETPGKFPKVGPSLRHVASKVGFEWLYAWLRNPQDFRPSTKMPRFFGLWEHLEGAGLEESERYEPLEIRSMIAYLTSSSQPFNYIEPYQGITASADVVRGKKVVEVRGCLACHQHADFPAAESNHGPDLSRIGAKVASQPNGVRWLYSWLRNPAAYHPRTIMPNVLLEPVTHEDGSVSDPAADAVAYLLQSTEGWKPEDIPAATMSGDEKTALEELAMLYLESRFPSQKASTVLRDGLPEGTRILGDEEVFVGLAAAERDEVLLNYVGKKTIGKLACYSCHDIPGFEDAKPAGAALADWGRKDPSRIAFEQVVQFVMHDLSHGGHHDDPHKGMMSSHAEHGEAKTDPAHDAHSGETHGVGEGDIEEDDVFATDLAYGVGEEEGHISPESLDPDTGYFLEKLLAHEREGFLWQKLRRPRSYDYKKVENKSYNERYRMPQFPFDAKQREKVMTFVLGLVADPPASEFVYSPSPREKARLDGLVVAERFNCSGCHTLQMDRWDLAYEPETMGEPPAFNDYPFFRGHFSPDQVRESLEVDTTGRRRTSLVGMPILDPETGNPQLVDEDGIPVERDEEDVIFHRPVMLWKDALVDGEARLVGGPNVFVPEDAIQAGKHYPAKGGELARLLFPVVIEDEKAINPNVKPSDAWGWLPPPLVGEGKKVQSPWLHKFFLNPHPIRPAAVLRMPKFNLQSSQAAALVDYFSAVDGAEYPYVYDSRLDESSVDIAEKQHPGHLDGAMRIVTNNNYCVKCHLVGDYAPPGNPKALAPQLERVHERLRPDYVHGWIANPKRYLPYTGMPVNIPYDKPVSQDLYAGDSEQQLGALTDLLMHYDEFTKRQFSLDPYLPQTASPPAEEQAREGSVEQNPETPKVSEKQAKAGDPSPNDITEKSGSGDSVNAGNSDGTDLSLRGAKAYETVAQVESPL
ncbi:MAG: PDZ domain-containing protein [Pirellulales bacterium]